MGRRRVWVSGILAAALWSCNNAGESRITAVNATGVVRGVIFFDLNGNGVPDAGIDDSVRNIRVRLVMTTTQDSVAGAVSLVSGAFRMTDVPVGRYRLVVDTVPLADTAVVTRIDSAEVSVLPSDSLFITVALSYPRVSIRQARTTVPLGRKVFITGVVLNSATQFRDTTMHVQDTSAAIRTTRVRPTAAAPGDSVRIRGTTSQRNGQRTLDDVSTFTLVQTFLPAASSVTTAVAATAQNGALDARQVLVTNVTVSDTAPVGADFRLTVSDGSGPLEVLLDGQADPAFRAPLLPGVYKVGNRFNIVGLAVPTGTPGLWRIKPRSAQDLQIQP